LAKRNLYLTNVPVEEALEKYFAALEGLLLPGFEEIAVTDSLDRVTKAAVYAKCNSPLYNAAAMDGIAVIASVTAGANEAAPLSLTRGRDFAVVDTGDPIRPPRDAVIMAEDTIEVDENTVRILAAASPWQHIRPIGEDIVASEMILPGRHRIRPMDIGVLLSGGVTSVEVYKKPRVAIFPTGDEIVESGEILKEGQIIESNTRMFQALVSQGGGEALRFPVIPDEFTILKETIQNAAEEYDMVLVNAGSSAGTEDYTVHVLRELGEVIIHGVAMKPGKPVILAKVNNVPVIGLPGYPVSAYLAYENFAAPVLAVLSGFAGPSLRRERAETVEAVLAKRLVSSLKHREYVRVKLGKVDGKLIASPLARGAGAAMSLVRADGFCIIEQNREGIDAGETAPIELSRPLSEIERTAVCIGSHDLILDLIADMMAQGKDCFLASTHVGSMGGLMALKRGECHITPIHLLDEESGEYNVPYLSRLFSGGASRSVSLVKGVGRVQGLMVLKGNPLNIKTVADLKRRRYINRQRGAGTRLFLDYLIKGAGISPEEIEGCNREAVTHMAVAAAVQSGGADTGMGIASAAAALGLDFIPLGNEEYDFAIPSRFLELEPVRAFLEILRSDAFHKRLGELGGYTWDRCGTIR
jgi:putative molybdopterin biosynthesis protein